MCKTNVIYIEPQSLNYHNPYMKKIYITQQWYQVSKSIVRSDWPHKLQQRGHHTPDEKYTIWKEKNKGGRGGLILERKLLGIVQVWVKSPTFDRNVSGTTFQISAIFFRLYFVKVVFFNMYNIFFSFRIIISLYYIVVIEIL